MSASSLLRRLAVTVAATTLASFGGCPSGSNAGDSADEAAAEQVDDGGTGLDAEPVSNVDTGGGQGGSSSSGGDASSSSGSGATGSAGNTTIPDNTTLPPVEDLPLPTVEEGDLNGDGTVDQNDVLRLISSYGQAASGDSADYDHDGDVDIVDLAILVNLITQITDPG